jgi:hypothetical protein
MYLIQLQDLKDQERKSLDSFVPCFFTCTELFSELLPVLQTGHHAMHHHLNWFAQNLKSSLIKTCIPCSKFYTKEYWLKLHPWDLCPFASSGDSSFLPPVKTNNAILNILEDPLFPFTKKKKRKNCFKEVKKKTNFWNFQIFLKIMSKLPR